MEKFINLAILIILIILDFVFVGMSAFIPVFGAIILFIRFIVHIIEIVIGKATNKEEISTTRSARPCDLHLPAAFSAPL